MNNRPPINLQLYQIRLKGHLDSQWAAWFDGLTVTMEEDGNTLLSGPVADQAALHGLLRKVRDLGMPLVSVVPVQSDLSEQGEKMNINTPPAKKFDMKALLSTLWIVVMINMAYADILSLHIPGAFDEVAKTSASTGTTIPQLMLSGAIMTEISITMILLSRVLKHGINRWVNIVVSIITTAYIWGGMAPYPHYIFIATVETICLLLIIGVAWVYRKVEA